MLFFRQGKSISQHRLILKQDTMSRCGRRPCNLTSEERDIRARKHQASYKIRKGIKTIDDYDQETWFQKERRIGSFARGEKRKRPEDPSLLNAWQVRRRYAMVQIEAGKKTDDDYDEEWRCKHPQRGRKIGTGQGSKYTEQEKAERARKAARKSRALIKIGAGLKTLDDYDDEWCMLNKSNPCDNVNTKKTTKKRTKKIVLVVIPDVDELPPPPLEWILDMDDDAVLYQ